MPTRITVSDYGTVSDSWRVAAREAMEARGIGTKALAEELGASRQYLGRLLRDSPTIPIETYRRICARLEIDPDLHLEKSQ
jgi:transcriptional regulator with XRE-family HTH domain